MSIKLNYEDLINVKEQPLVLNGVAGELEAIFNGAPINESMPKLIAIIGHPHSLHGGTMNNKVVTTLARSCRDIGIPSLRFNFRGVGNSSGEFDAGTGESEDLLAIMANIKKLLPDYKIILAGFSFGSYVTYRAACQSEVELLISVAPAVNNGDFTEFAKVPNPWHVMVALDDELVPAENILDWHKNLLPKPVLHEFEATSRFFHGKLVVLRQKVSEILSTLSV